MNPNHHYSTKYNKFAFPALINTPSFAALHTGTMLKRICILISLAFMLLYGLSGCSTKKSTWLTRGYHRMNTRYNGYYYAREAIKDGVLKIEKSNIDDYSNILPIFVYASKESAKMASATLKKPLKVYQRH